MRPAPPPPFFLRTQRLFFLVASTTWLGPPGSWDNFPRQYQYGAEAALTFQSTVERGVQELGEYIHVNFADTRSKIKTRRRGRSRRRNPESETRTQTQPRPRIKTLTHDSRHCVTRVGGFSPTTSLKTSSRSARSTGTALRRSRKRRQRTTSKPQNKTALRDQNGAKKNAAAAVDFYSGMVCDYNPFSVSGFFVQMEAGGHFRDRYSPPPSRNKITKNPLVKPVPKMPLLKARQLAVDLRVLSGGLRRRHARDGVSTHQLTSTIGVPPFKLPPAFFRGPHHKSAAASPMSYSANAGIELRRAVVELNFPVEFSLEYLRLRVERHDHHGGKCPASGDIEFPILVRGRDALGGSKWLVHGHAQQVGDGELPPQTLISSTTSTRSAKSKMRTSTTSAEQDLPARADSTTQHEHRVFEVTSADTAQLDLISSLVIFSTGSGASSSRVFLEELAISYYQDDEGYLEQQLTDNAHLFTNNAFRRSVSTRWFRHRRRIHRGHAAAPFFAPEPDGGGFERRNKENGDHDDRFEIEVDAEPARPGSSAEEQMREIREQVLQQVRPGTPEHQVELLIRHIEMQLREQNKEYAEGERRERERAGEHTDDGRGGRGFAEGHQDLGFDDGFGFELVDDGRDENDHMGGFDFEDEHYNNFDAGDGDRNFGFGPVGVEARAVPVDLTYVDDIQNVDGSDLGAVDANYAVDKDNSAARPYSNENGEDRLYEEGTTTRTGTFDESDFEDDEDDFEHGEGEDHLNVIHEQEQDGEDEQDHGGPRHDDPLQEPQGPGDQFVHGQKWLLAFPRSVRTSEQGGPPGGAGGAGEEDEPDGPQAEEFPLRAAETRMLQMKRLDAVSASPVVSLRELRDLNLCVRGRGGMTAPAVKGDEGEEVGKTDDQRQGGSGREPREDSVDQGNNADLLLAKMAGDAPGMQLGRSLVPSSAGAAGGGTAAGLTGTVVLDRRTRSRGDGDQETRRRTQNKATNKQRGGLMFGPSRIAPAEEQEEDEANNSRGEPRMRTTGATDDRDEVGIMQKQKDETHKRVKGTASDAPTSSTPQGSTFWSWWHTSRVAIFFRNLFVSDWSALLRKLSTDSVQALLMRTSLPFSSTKNIAHPAKFTAARRAERHWAMQLLLGVFQPLAHSGKTGHDSDLETSSTDPERPRSSIAAPYTDDTLEIHRKPTAARAYNRARGVIFEESSGEGEAGQYWMYSESEESHPLDIVDETLFLDSVAQQEMGLDADGFGSSGVDDRAIGEMKAVVKNETTGEQRTETGRSAGGAAAGAAESPSKSGGVTSADEEDLRDLGDLPPISSAAINELAWLDEQMADFLTQAEIAELYPGVADLTAEVKAAAAEADKGEGIKTPDQLAHDEEVEGTDTNSSSSTTSANSTASPPAPGPEQTSTSAPKDAAKQVEGDRDHVEKDHEKDERPLPAAVASRSVARMPASSTRNTDSTGEDFAPLSSSYALRHGTRSCLAERQRRCAVVARQSSTSRKIRAGARHAIFASPTIHLQGEPRTKVSGGGLLSVVAPSAATPPVAPLDTFPFYRRSLALLEKLVDWCSNKFGCLQLTRDIADSSSRGGGLAASMKQFVREFNKPDYLLDAVSSPSFDDFFSHLWEVNSGKLEHLELLLFRFAYLLEFDGLDVHSDSLQPRSNNIHESTTPAAADHVPQTSAAEDLLSPTTTVGAFYPTPPAVPQALKRAQLLQRHLTANKNRRPDAFLFSDLFKRTLSVFRERWERPIRNARRKVADIANFVDVQFYSLVEVVTVNSYDGKEGLLADQRFFQEYAEWRPFGEKMDQASNDDPQREGHTPDDKSQHEDVDQIASSDTTAGVVNVSSAEIENATTNSTAASTSTTTSEAMASAARLAARGAAGVQTRLDALRELKKKSGEHHGNGENSNLRNRAGVVTILLVNHGSGKSVTKAMPGILDPDEFFQYLIKTEAGGEQEDVAYFNATIRRLITKTQEIAGLDLNAGSEGADML